MLGKNTNWRNSWQYIAPVTGAFLAVIIGGLIIGLPMLIGTWLPDVFTGNVKTVASISNARGDSFVVTQQWGSDFYTTWLTHSEVSGRITRIVLDGDGPKLWRCELRCDEETNTLYIPLFGHDVKYHWDFHTRYTLAGDKK